MKHWGLYRIAIATLIAAMGLPGLQQHAVALSLKQTQAVNSEDKLQTTLRPGAVGSSVKDIQAILSLMGYYTGPINGTYDQSTIAAVQQLQTEIGLTADGIVGPVTWQRILPSPTILNQPIQPATQPETENTAEPAPNIETTPIETAGNPPTLRLEDRGTDVQRLQNKLKGLNFYSGPIDGVFGEQTEAAVADFQRQSGLEVDGIVGAATWQRLLQ